MTYPGLLASAFLLASSVAVLAAEVQLLMFEQPGCIHCAAWNKEVAPEYPLTEEGRAAPLRRLQLRDPLPEGVELVSPPVFTPTFVLVENGAEAGRIEGYPGEDFFWPLLARMIAEAAQDGEAAQD
ncbi:thioredoxin family protein [Rhodobacteraceae bacterium HSP-20]|uniref:Thioredoxin family protein n=1 Tax=Paragemmobacter amnigenus TaxID=2852097 RepID=A0ABS6J912_9RHOB|nr:thioredoxin family protein [Rhodobacter amnigenus]MBV4390092.1 thioredoxin family protein [Rhodobacter amnigenus]